ncbi:hypothetical protein FOZ61_010623 [Perkinsus olseni]|uniref:Uncharacterized protein n=1 Tax=Perkinsus olseni TaxID=32597 RepID=A0A7J6KXX5_PEROL|nr:hypothetical protein FOZ61_010623 [Perkinsus olseni]
MVSSPHSIIAILFAFMLCSGGVDVSFSSQEWLLPTNDICGMFSLGVNKFLLEGTTVVNDGSVFSEVLNVTKVNEIADCAKKFGTSMSLLLWTDDYPFDECSRSTFNFTTLKHQLQSYVTQYDVDEVTFWIWVGNCQQFSWQIARKIGWIIRTKLRTRLGKSLRASLGFAAEPFDSPLWQYIRPARLGRYYNTISVHFGSPGVVDSRAVDDRFARAVVERLVTLGISPRRIELSVAAQGYQKLTLQPSTYFELSKKGAPPFSNGYFEDYVYQSQQQVVEKTHLIEERGLRGFSLQTIDFDLPVKNRSSLLYAALYY